MWVMELSCYASHHVFQHRNDECHIQFCLKQQIKCVNWCFPCKYNLDSMYTILSVVNFIISYIGKRRVHWTFFVSILEYRLKGIMWKLEEQYVMKIYLTLQIGTDFSRSAVFKLSLTHCIFCLYFCHCKLESTSVNMYVKEVCISEYR